MPAKSKPIYPSEQKILADLGERIKLARLRRGISAEVLAERSAISRVTLHRAEKGQSAALHLERDFELLAKDDILGRRLQDLGLSKPGVKNVQA
jgi:transcriptional regulator with XRE-family HTH domain